MLPCWLPEQNANMRMMPRKTAQKPGGATIPPYLGEGGIFRDVDALEGTDVFNIYGADGKRIGTWEAGEGSTDEALLTAFGEFLERKDARHLRIIPPSERPS